jgi:hypothetical protein
MSTAPQIMSFLYTQNLRGDLHFLPRLSRVLMRLRTEDRRTITVDLGGACAPDVWHCDATSGRSMLIALDGLNYAAANAETLPDDARPHLLRSLVSLVALGAANPARLSELFLAVAPPENVPANSIVLVVRPHPEAQVSGAVIELPAVERYHVGRMRVRTDGPALELVSVETIDVPPETPPDPTIVGMIDFIEAEARQFLKRKPPS